MISGRRGGPARPPRGGQPGAARAATRGGSSTSAAAASRSRWSTPRACCGASRTRSARCACSRSWPGSDEEPGRFRELLEEYVAALRLPSVERFGTPAGFIATGGNIEALARLAEPAAAGDVTVTLPLARLRAVIDTLARLSFRQRVTELGLREDRADVVLPAALVYERLATLAGCDEILVPFVGLKDGIALDLVDELTAARAHRDRQERETVAAAIALGRHYAFDEAHARQVAELALSLFDQLAELARPRAARAPHPAGGGAAPRHRPVRQLQEAPQAHACTCCMHSELAGFSPADMELVANVARYHRRAEPDPSHWAYVRLTSRDREPRRPARRRSCGWPTPSTASTASACAASTCRRRRPGS